MLFEAVIVLLLIVLVFVLYAMITSSESSTVLTLSGFNLSQEYGGNMFIGPGNTLYTVGDDYVYAISTDGRVLWRMQIPDDYGDMYNHIWIGQQAAFDGNFLYILVKPIGTPTPVVGEVLEIAPGGNILWNKNLDQDILTNNPTGTPYGLNLQAAGHMVYIHAGDNEATYDKSGSLIWHLSNVYFMPAMGEDGDLYVVPGDNTCMQVDAYRPDGTLEWSYNLGADALNVNDIGKDQITYDNKTIYVNSENSLLAIDENGSLKWKKSFDGSHVSMSLVNSNWYIMNNNTGDTNASHISIVHPDGTEVQSMEMHLPAMNYGPMITNDLIIDWGPMEKPGFPDIHDLPAWYIDAYNVTTGEKLWDETIVPSQPTSVTLDNSNVDEIMNMIPEDSTGMYNLNDPSLDEWFKEHSLPSGYTEMRNWSNVQVTPYNGGVYVTYWGYNYQYPIILNKSQCVYAGEIYTINKTGTVLWANPTNSEVSSLVTNNSTVYYGTKSGQLSIGNTNVISGIALTTIFYLFIRFFVAGAVTRARRRIDSNNNRNQILKYITDNPGASLYDISKSLGINMGTVRYHLMILALNHRITSFRADEKYVRYFTNAGSYSKEQQLVISLMRRDGIRKVLNQLLEKPGLTNLELARELGVHESLTIRILKELLTKGILIKYESRAGRQAYQINNIYQDEIARAVKNI